MIRELTREHGFVRIASISSSIISLSLSLSLLIRISIYINTSPAISPSAYSLGASALYADLLVILISDLLNVLSSTPDKTCVVEVSTFNNSRIARSPPVLKNVTKD